MTKMKTNFLMLALAVLAVMAPSGAFALNSVGTTACEVFECIVSSNLLIIIATVAIFFLGIGAFFGKLNWGLVVVISLGIVVIVGAMSIANTLVTSGTTSGTCGNNACDLT